METILCYIFHMASIDEEIKSRFPNEKARFLANLIFTANWFQNKFIDFLKPYGVSPEQFNILRILRGTGDWMTMNDIKSRMMDKAPNATRLADKLLEKGYVMRKRSESDRRVVYLNLTKEGSQLLEDIDRDPGMKRDPFLENISEKDAKKFSAILDKIRIDN